MSKVYIEGFTLPKNCEECKLTTSTELRLGAYNEEHSCNVNGRISWKESQLSSPHVFAGLKPEGIAVFNARRLPEPRPDPNIRLVGWVDATRVALEEMGTAITNTCMLGAFAATTQWINLDSILRSLGQYFEGKLLSMNTRSVERGFHEVAIKEYC